MHARGRARMDVYVRPRSCTCKRYRQRRRPLRAQSTMCAHIPMRFHYARMHARGTYNLSLGTDMTPHLPARSCVVAWRNGRIEATSKRPGATTPRLVRYRHWAHGRGRCQEPGTARTRREPTMHRAPYHACCDVTARESCRPPSKTYPPLGRPQFDPSFHQRRTKTQHKDTGQLSLSR
jgi:hypothetical protein